MIYVENVFLCLMAPILIGVLCLEKPQRKSLLFLLSGMLSCFLSAYINSFFAGVYQVSAELAAVEIAPVVEEILKLLPFLFYLAIFQPREKESRMALTLIALGFATFENVCWLMGSGSEGLSRILVRGFSTGTMHMVAGFIVGSGMLYVWDRAWLYIAGTAGLLGVAITLHGIFNLLISAEAPVSVIGSFLPITVFIFLYCLIRAKMPKTKELS